MKSFESRMILMLFAVSFAAAMVAGCGGTTSSSAVHGTVSDIERNVVIDARVWIGGQQTRSLASGAFRLPNAPSGWQTIRASATVNGATWEGTTAVEVLRDGPTMNANIVLSPASQQTSIEGYVKDSTGKGVSGARVLLTTRLLRPSDSSAYDGPYGSIVAVTDGNGRYTMRDVPLGLSAVISASKVAFENDEVEIPNITSSMWVDFRLYESTLDTPEPPTLEYIESYTMPNPLTRSLSASSVSGSNPYDAVRAFTSERFREALKTRKQPEKQTMAVRAVSPDSLIEIDLYWNALDANLSKYLAGYGIYRKVGSAARQAIDFVRDPYANFYGDMGGEIEPGLSYYYRVSAVHTEFLDRWNEWIDESESNWSNELSVTPLGYLRSSLPANGGSVSGNPLFTWQALSRAVAYSVYLYDRFPTIPLDPGGDYGGDPPSYGVFPIWTSDWEDVTSVRYDGSPLRSGRTYYWIVTAVDYTETAYSYAELRSFVAD
ncbi:MAG: carboxypeptidase regulatory-like domain-containing protein [Armatimonadetes bacterium]|nr:carboxypeptidase regulatory-like domain-containing protein [Armatimonadota bacterium]